MMSLRALANLSIRLISQKQHQHKLVTNFTQTAAYCSKYYSKKKLIKPSVMPVTKANKHLEINLFDHDDKPLGVMPMERAKTISTEKNMKLVMVDEEQNPPKFRLMTGAELAASQMEKRAKNKEERALHAKGESQEKEIRLTIKSAENDIKTKLTHMQELIDKGFSIKMRINSKMPPNTEPGHLSKIQDDFLQKLRSFSEMPKFNLKSKNANEIILLISGKQA